MDEVKSQTEQLLNLQRAAHLRADAISPSLFQFLGYRQMVAQQVLRETNDVRRNELMELYEYANKNIKTVLGL